MLNAPRRTIFESGTKTHVKKVTTHKEKRVNGADPDLERSNLDGSPPPFNEQQEREKLDDLVKRTDHVLYHVKGIWPFDFFPNELLIDTLKVSFIFRGFLTRETRSVLIKDITDVVVDANPFFATLTLVDRGMVENSVSMRFLNVQEAFRARRLIQGLSAARHEMNIDFAMLPLDELLVKLEKLGESRLNN